MTESEKESYDWYKKIVDSYRLKKDVSTGDFKAQERRAIKEGSFISFAYKNPVGKDKKSLRFYDEFPVDVILSIRGNSLLALNFHYIPPPMRFIVIKFILQLNKQRIKAGKRLLLEYQMIKEFIKRNGLELMIHRYRVNRITSLKYIKGSELKYIVSLPSERFIIQDKSITKSDLYSMIRNNKNKTKTAKNVRFGRSTSSANKRTTSTKTKSSRTKRK